MSEDSLVELAVENMELARRSAVLCKAIALYQERSPNVNRLPSTLMRLVDDLQVFLTGERKCKTPKSAGNARSAGKGMAASRVSGRRSGSSATRRKKVMRMLHVSGTYNPGALLNHEFD